MMCDCSIEETVLGALLHDVGKPMQRAFNSVEEVTGSKLYLESTLCPVYKGRYSHKHVLYTSAFFDLMRGKGISFPARLNIGHVETIASFHHNPDASPLPAASWICAIADRLSAGMDRRDDEEDDHPGGREAFRKTPLRCIFDEVVLDARARGTPGRHYHQLAPLDPEDPRVLIPREWKQGEDLFDDLPLQYKGIWDSFWSQFERAVKTWPNIPFHLFEEILLGLLEHYFWAVPSSTIDSPDISLYDHARTTAAIAASLYRYHQARGELNNVEAIKNTSMAKFRFLSGDLSGIQNTLFTLQTQGVKGVNKILRARSFVIGALIESAALKVLEIFNLPMSSMIQQAGGRFLVLVPNVENAEDKVGELQHQLDSWLLNRYTGSLSLNLALSGPFTASDFQPNRLSLVMAQLCQHIEEAKYRPLSSVTQGVLKMDFPRDKICSACGIRPAVSGSDEEARCLTCEGEFQVGRRLVRGRFIVWGRALPRQWHPLRFFDLELAILTDALEEVREGILSVQRIGEEERAIPWSYRALANYVPIFKSAQELQDPRYGWIPKDEVKDIKPLDMKTFQHIAAASLEFNSDGNLIGRPYLGLLKADVDYLGFIFGLGLRRDDPGKDRLSLSRVAQLSRMLDLYFTGYLKGLLRREFPDTYTIYAGGDDLLLIGPWHQSLYLARRIYETFQDYTGRNPNITLSAGVALMKPNYPVNRSVREAESFLEKAKDDGRNRICALFRKSIPWDRYVLRLEDAEWINERLRGPEAVSTSFIYKLLSIIQDAEIFASQGDLNKASWRARLAYHLTRNIKGRDLADKHRRIVEWLERLGIDNQLQFTTRFPNLYDWRLPLQIALYRNRT